MALHARAQPIVWQKPLAFAANPYLSLQGQLTRPMLARLARHGTEHTGTEVGSFKGRHGTAGTAQLARHGWHGTMHVFATAGTIILARIFISARHGTVRHVASLPLGRLAYC